MKDSGNRKDPPQHHQEGARDMKENPGRSAEWYERLLNTIPCVLYDYVRWPDGTNQFIYISPKCREIFGYDAEKIMASRTLLWEMVHPDDVARLRQEDRRANRDRVGFQSEVRIRLPSGREKWIQLTSSPSDQRMDGQTVWSGVILDITRRKCAEEAKDDLLLKLQEALARVKTLSGLLPICSHCKKIRDDKGYWRQIELYIKERSETEFTHSICPDCAANLYPELLDEK